MLRGKEYIYFNSPQCLLSKSINFKVYSDKFVKPECKDRDIKGKETTKEPRKMGKYSIRKIKV